MKLKTKKNKRNKRNKTKKLKGGFFFKKKDFNELEIRERCYDEELKCLIDCGNQDIDNEYECEDECRKSLKKCKSKGNSFCSIL
jgi:hypothetical protein